MIIVSSIAMGRKCAHGHAKNAKKEHSTRQIVEFLVLLRLRMWSVRVVSDHSYNIWYVCIPLWIVSIPWGVKVLTSSSNIFNLLNTHKSPGRLSSRVAESGDLVATKKLLAILAITTAMRLDGTFTAVIIKFKNSFVSYCFGYQIEHRQSLPRKIGYRFELALTIATNVNPGKFVSIIPQSNRPALSLARKLGFRTMGVLPGAAYIAEADRLEGLVLSRLTREEVLAHG
ncbi:hypothetical protein [Alkalidesulfovibrio alkalitolerans]|nr:hypothetical protein [Alkalidesulfovibrio alkalitolerans]